MPELNNEMVPQPIQAGGEEKENTSRKTLLQSLVAALRLAKPQRRSNVLSNAKPNDVSTRAQSSEILTPQQDEGDASVKPAAVGFAFGIVAGVAAGIIFGIGLTLLAVFLSREEDEGPAEDSR